MRWLRRALLALAVALVVVVGLAWLVIGTERGTRLALESLARLVPALSLQGVGGRLLDRVSMEHLVWHDASVEVQAEGVRIDWQPQALLWARPTLRMHTLSLERLQVVLAPPADPPPVREPMRWPPEIPPLTLPLAAELAQLRVTDVGVWQQRVGASRQQLVALDEVIAAVSMNEAAARITRFEAHGPGGQASLTAALGIEAPHPLRIEPRLDWALAGEAGSAVQRITASGVVAGTLAAANVDLDVRAPVAVQLDGSIAVLAAPPSANLVLRWDVLRWPLNPEQPALLESAGGSLALRGPASALALRLDSALALPGVAELPAERVRVDLHGDLASPAARGVDLQLDWRLSMRDDTPPLAGGGTLSGTPQALRIVQALRAPFDINLQALLERPLDAPPALAAQVAWGAVRWPLLGEPLVSSPAGTLSANGPLGELRLELASELRPRALAPIAIDIAATVDDRRLAIERATLRPPSGALRVAGEIEFAPAVALDLGIDVDDLPWPFTGTAAALVERATLVARGPPSALVTEADARLSLPGLATLDASLRGVAGESDFALERLALRLGEGQLSAAGRLVWGGGLHSDLRGEWTRLRWPPTDSVFASDSGRFSVVGPPTAMAVTLSADASSDGMPPLDLDLDSMLDVDAGQASDMRLRARLLGGEISVSGSGGWQPAPTWDLQLTATDIEPGRWPGLGEALPGKLAALVGTRGSVDAGEARGQLVIDSLQGSLRGYPLDARGKVVFQGPSLQLEDIRLRSADNTLNLAGSVSRSALDFSVRLAAPKLASAWPGLAGQLDLRADVSGAPGAPRVVLDASGDGVAFDDNRIARLRASGTVDLAGPSDLVLDAAGVRGVAAIDRLNVRLRGRAEDHSLLASVAAPQGTAEATLAGAYTAAGSTGGGPLWDGQIRALTMVSTLR